MSPEDRGWINALLQIAAVMLTIRDIKAMGFTDEDILGAQHLNQARAMVDSWLNP